MKTGNEPGLLTRGLKIANLLTDLLCAVFWDSIYALVWLVFIGVRIRCALGFLAASPSGGAKAVSKRLVLAFSALLLTVSQGRADDVLLQLDTPFPGDPSPAGAGPWVDAYFHTVTPGTVLLTITNVNLTSGEFIAGNGGGVYLNLNPASGYDPTQLVFTQVASNGNYNASVATGENAFKSDGDGYYDIQIDFSHAFSTDGSITYQITGIAGLTAGDFAYLSSDGGAAGIYYAAAHVQGLSGGTSTWIGNTQAFPEPVPEPSALALAATGVIACLIRRKQPKTKAPDLQAGCGGCTASVSDSETQTIQTQGTRT